MGSKQHSALLILLISSSYLLEVSAKTSYIWARDQTGTCEYKGYTPGGGKPILEPITPTLAKAPQSALAKIVGVKGAKVAGLAGPMSGLVMHGTKLLKLFQAASSLGPALGVFGAAMGVLGSLTKVSTGQIMSAVNTAITQLTADINNRLDKMKGYVDSKVLDLEKELASKEYRHMFTMWGNCAEESSERKVANCMLDAIRYINAGASKFYKASQVTQYPVPTEKSQLSRDYFESNPSAAPPHYEVKRLEIGIMSFREFVVLRLMALQVMANTYKTAMYKMPPPSVDNDCIDNSPDCDRLKKLGYCTNKEWTVWISSYCKQTCDFCLKDGPVLPATAPPPTQPPPPTLPPTTPKPCFNKDDSCAKWADEGYCHIGKSTKYMKDNCCLACKSEVLTDLNTACPLWADEGGCTEDLEPAAGEGPPMKYVQENCKLACRNAVLASCVDKKPNCPELAGKGFCTTKDPKQRFYIDNYCCDSCKVGVPPIDAPTEAPEVEEVEEVEEEEEDTFDPEREVLNERAAMDYALYLKRLRDAAKEAIDFSDWSKEWINIRNCEENKNRNMGVCQKGSKLYEGWPAKHTVSWTTCKGKFQNMVEPTTCKIKYQMRVDGKQSSSYIGFFSSNNHGSNTEEQIRSDGNSKFNQLYDAYISPLCRDVKNFMAGELDDATATWEKVREKADREYNAMKAKGYDRDADASDDEYSSEFAGRMKRSIETMEKYDSEFAERVRRSIEQVEMETDNAADEEDDDIL